jgi:5-methyltetrahydrofolate--homocysteine methyltransferase
MEPILKEIYQGIIDAEQDIVREKVQQALNMELEAGKILSEGMVPAMTEVGRLFEEGEYFVPEMLVCARAMKAGMSVLKPVMVEQNLQAVGRVVAGTVKGDLHDIGKNLVCMMLEGAAFEIYDLGSDVSPDAFVDKIKNTDANIVVLSALLTTTMPNMKNTIEALNTAGLRDKVKVMVGGAPLTQKYADDIGADGYAPDASRAVALAKRLVGA